MIIDVQFLSSKRMLGYGTTELRCVQPVEYLREAGWRASASCIADAVPLESRIVVLHRVKLDAVAKRVIRLARLCGSVVIYDIDDLIFEPTNSDAGLSRNEAEAVRAAMLQADVVTVSTTFLGDRVPAEVTDRLVMRNGLSREFMKVAEAESAREKCGRDRVTIGYFSGSNHHDDDFAIVEPALLEVMRRSPEVNLVLAGKIRFSPEFKNFGERFSFELFRPYSEFISLLGQIDINIVPLDVRSDFANARSELKYIEAGAFGVPTVASPTMAYVEAITSGVNGVLCSNGEWYEVLSALVRDRKARVDLGSAARCDVQTRFGPDVRVREWSDFVQVLLSEAARPKRSDVLITLTRAEIVILHKLNASRMACSRLAGRARKASLGWS